MNKFPNVLILASFVFTSTAFAIDFPVGTFTCDNKKITIKKVTVGDEPLPLVIYEPAKLNPNANPLMGATLSAVQTAAPTLASGQKGPTYVTIQSAMPVFTLVFKDNALFSVSSPGSSPGTNNLVNCK